MDDFDCKPCMEYANKLLNHGDILPEELQSIAFSRHHMLNRCAKPIDSFIEWIDFAIENQVQLLQEFEHDISWNKGYLEALNDAKDRYLSAKLLHEDVDL